ncbi:MAG: cytochrome c554 family protein [Candidatus Jettenia sp.]|uniref:Putative heme protein n=1 Tax=Candidatus Jettenia caeni TaxID=247490 RepID=I3IPZ2_9BACT|nr:multiheme c-type cytochrome [Candidatus Jettenia sp. AMX1]MBC6928952.1 cytochrome c554 family protein [Candidatus Jettenia sp.]WKZ15107.1 MAG: multiheme c-type cytochrome [Candidatus Jettenia caeni]KAA0250379.1 MAG: cytochrome c554 family protein [Candidatus Jettenia sp. AMX1]MCE7880913.1 cytochrome c554 family protein [Candidatus Jettenia sp. AMX1]MCQ3927003.1 cytochrome c554 family protein [Candidatus Jettenia sp.]
MRLYFKSMFYVMCSLSLLSLNASFASDPKEWSPTWKLPPGKRPENIVDLPITVPGDVRISQFFSPISCGSCHPEIFKMWSGSTHANAWKNPLFQALYNLGKKTAEGESQKRNIESCVRCHFPIGHSAGDANLPVDDEKGGVICDFCHSVRATTGIGNAPYILSPGNAAAMEGGIKYGPFKDSPETIHGSQYSELHTRSEFCGGCHDVSHAGNDLPIEQTYTEWRQGPYNTNDPETTVHCQDCHMRQRPGFPSTGSTDRPDNPGLASPEIMGGKKRPHIWTHYFVGGSVSQISLPPNSEVQPQMAIDRLKNAATLEVVANPNAKKGDILKFQVNIKNTGAGHYLPTGLTELRQMWLETSVTDAEDKIIYQSGKVDEKGNVDPNATIYHTVFGDENGKQTLHVWTATHIISDNRIPPKGQKEEHFVCLIPGDAKSPLKVKAVLHYRSAPQDIVDTLLGEKSIKLPVIDMAEILAEVNL